MKDTILQCARSFSYLLILFAVSGCINSSNSAEPDHLKKVVYRGELETSARRAAEAGRYAEAIALYQQAIEPQNINHRHEMSMAIGSMGEVYKWTGNYEKAMEMNNWFLEGNKDSMRAQIEKSEIKALIRYKETGDRTQIDEHIQKIKDIDKGILPPNGWAPHATTTISDILRLYDTIGDHDAGVAYIDMIIDYAYGTDPNYQTVDRSISAVEARRRSAKKQADGAPNFKWREYDWLAEFLAVREAFEQDKKQGARGRATRVIIQSDYFPW